MLKLISVVCLALPCFGQFPGPPRGVKVIEAHSSNTLISYKKTTICETTPGVNAYAGYVHLPPDTLLDSGFKQTDPINTFFWFFESRKDPRNAPLTIVQLGGLGVSPLSGPLVLNGPCIVEPDSNSTSLNSWSWNTDSNMLYLDQPVSVGFSYNSLQNYTVDLVSNEFTELNNVDEIPKQNTTSLVGTFSKPGETNVVSTLTAAAASTWHFLQTWVQEFPHYEPKDRRYNLATDGGSSGPTFFEYFERQNERIRNTDGQSASKQMVLTLDTLFMTSPCTDPMMYQSYPEIVQNNTYEIEIVNASIRGQMLDMLYKQDGCLDQLWKCGNLSQIYDREGTGANASVNQVCADANQLCNKMRQLPLDVSGRNIFDFTSRNSRVLDQFYEGYLNHPHVQDDLGVPLNWTSYSEAVRNASLSTAQAFHRNPDRIAYLLDRGIKVHLMYGDRSYGCNWLAGENFSLRVNYAHASQFRSAGYAPISVNTSCTVAGQVRQHGNFSFSLVYDAPLAVAAYQRETAFRVFDRALNNLDIATGKIQMSERYQTNGPQNIRDMRREVPKPALDYCYTLSPGEGCTDEQIAMLENGTAVVKDFILVDRNSTELFPEVVGTY
ncbi:Carboxypeptidase S1 B [Cercospora beticola]|uniref:Carboxypeptidase S1 B n=1 Tax=Cercospora beticola TaxID=122368 RepID=A0A2G5HDL8_CERBT|nr:Carboxypeptidase S1 B [Cercospora beticola]PIA90631.1 Carboxypeptidase S1 B [Cercospora beticola]WPB08170.1 hypothetical protein RHO25_012834 [Cercospora beticola]CAK1367963.1 unnamed protein product [Cercospora beticola]